MSRLRRSEEAYRRFHNAEPRGWRKVDLPEPPEHAWKLGKLVALVYEPEEPSEKTGVQYEHEFGDGGILRFDRNKPTLYVSEDGRQIVIVRGKSRYRVDPDRGIMW